MKAKWRRKIHFRRMHNQMKLIIEQENSPRNPICNFNEIQIAIQSENVIASDVKPAEGV